MPSHWNSLVKRAWACVNQVLQKKGKRLFFQQSMGTHFCLIKAWGTEE